MPPKKPSTRKSPRAPKLQESEVGEGSSPAVARQLEFTPKPVSIIKTITKDPFVQPPAFRDMEASIGAKMAFPRWEEVFKKIKKEEPLEYTPHSDPDTRKLDDEVLPNIRKAYLHMVASRSPVFPCIELLKWIIDHADAQKCLINDDNGECVGVFLPSEVQSYYKLKDSELKLSTDFILSFYASHDTSKIMASWWREDKKFMNRTVGWYPTTNLREPYIYLMALLCRLHGEKDCSRFSEAWMPLAFTVTISGTGFNWGAIISKQLSTCIRQAQVPKEGDTPAFYMALYLLDVICARNAFAGMNLNWHSSELAVHVYFNILWENRYKKSYVVICDQFIARIYFFLFRKECPRLSDEAKKVIAKIGHWYLDERETYIRVFGATGAPHLLPIYVPDRLVLGEIFYQTILQGYNATLVKDKKWDFILYGFHIGFCMVKDTVHAKQLGLGQLEFWFQTGRFRKHDPKGLVLQHASQVSSCWPYAHDQFEDEIFTENAQDWNVVASRKDDPRGTRFRAMSYEEHATFLEQTVQEIGRTHQEVAAYELDEGISDPQGDIEAMGVNRESPIHIRDSPEVQTTQEMPELLYQQSQLLMR
jgi:hypothetical protein